jgi:hypothetical protein
VCKCDEFFVDPKCVEAVVKPRTVEVSRKLLADLMDHLVLSDDSETEDLYARVSSAYFGLEG